MSDTSARVLRTALAAYDASYPPDLFLFGGDPNGGRITSFEPDTISTAPEVFTIHGSQFNDGDTCTIGDTAATSTVYVDAGTLTVTADWANEPPGAVPVQVHGVNGDSNVVNITRTQFVPTQDDEG